VAKQNSGLGGLTELEGSWKGDDFGEANHLWVLKHTTLGGTLKLSRHQVHLPLDGNDLLTSPLPCRQENSVAGRQGPKTNPDSFLGGSPHIGIGAKKGRPWTESMINRKAWGQISTNRAHPRAKHSTRERPGDLRAFRFKKKSSVLGVGKLDTVTKEKGCFEKPGKGYGL